MCKVARTSIYDEKGGGLARDSTRQDDEAGCMPCAGVSLRRLDAVSRDQATTLLVPPQHHHHDNGTCCILVLSSSLVSQASPCRQKDQTQASNLLLHLAGPRGPIHMSKLYGSPWLASPSFFSEAATQSHFPHQTKCNAFASNISAARRFFCINTSSTRTKCKCWHFKS